jgi:adenosylcobinamide kinase / adenosylcobinamide-phosphate guanylyltransferase
MEVTLLGTGDAAGWPHPFCRCASCAAAYAAGEIRGHTSTLIDGVLLIDCGPDVTRTAVRLGVPLDGVRYFLVTHNHHDHAGGAALLTRRWAGGDGPLQVIGPPSALAAMSQWLPPGDPGVEFRPIAAGDAVTLGPYTVRALAADHDSDGAVIYDIATLQHRLLHAADTGPGFSTPPNARYDVVLLDNTWGDRPVPGATGHHSLGSFATTIATLRRATAIDDNSRIVAIHLGHGNPSPSTLRARLAVMGAELLPDGAEIRLGHAQVKPPARPRRTLVLGGARSGKSVVAERLLAADPVVVYVATATRDAADPEWHHRIAVHQSRRPAHWTTIETTDLADLLAVREADEPPLLIDCLTLWLSAVMERVGLWVSDNADARAAEPADAELAKEIDALVAAWHATAARVVAVSNEVGSGVVPAYASGRRFRDELGALNARLAAVSDDVLVVEAGIARPLLLHPLPEPTRWESP